jgi:phosphosulfolactate synthase
MLDDLVKGRVDDKKPRKEGLTYVIDKLHGTYSDNFEILSPMIDIVRMYGILPLLMPETLLQKRIKFYHNYDVRVSTGSTIAEYAIIENSLDRFATEAAKNGFDIIEIGENNIDLDTEQREKIMNVILSKGLEYHWIIGRKDPRHQLGVNRTLEKLDELMKLPNGIKSLDSGSNNYKTKPKVILEANEGINVGIYDEKGLIKWSFIEALTARYPPSDFIFETPLEHQQSAMIAEFGQRVNLAAVSIDNIAEVEAQRRGFLSKSSYDISYNRKEPEGGPAPKFIYYIIKTKHPIEQSELIALTHLPRRTIQNAIDELKQQGLVKERNSLEDTRKKIYDPVMSDWL